MNAALASLLLRMLALTWRFTVVGTVPHKPCVVVFWHGTMLPVWFAFRGRNATGLVSASKDGGLLARLLRDLRIDTIRGSSSQGGKEALDAMTDAARRRVMLVTPDGPRGPRHVCKAGALVAAQRAGVPLVLCSAVASRATILHRSWDRFMIPHPFARVAVIIGESVMIPPTATREQIEAMMSVTATHLTTLGGEH
jgi:lysophospholipid acyltransferase (LPLAT)-like uncharacterized protein